MYKSELPLTFDNLEELAAWAATDGRGRAAHLLILHDDDCPIASTGRCECSPSYVVEELTPENYLAGQRAQDDFFGKGKGSG